MIHWHELKVAFSALSMFACDERSVYHNYHNVLFAIGQFQNGHETEVNIPAATSQS